MNINSLNGVQNFYVSKNNTVTNPVFKDEKTQNENIEQSKQKVNAQIDFSNYKLPVFGKSIKNDKNKPDDSQINADSQDKSFQVPLSYMMGLFKPEEVSKARFKVLNTYQKNIQLQQNDILDTHIDEITRHIFNDEQAEAVLNVLNNNEDNVDEEYLKKLENLLMLNINPILIKKVMNNKPLRENISDGTLFALNRQPINSIIDTFDDYLKNYSNSKFITNELDYILNLSYIYPTSLIFEKHGREENTSEVASKIMQEFAEEDTLYKDESAKDFCNRMEQGFTDIVMGKNWIKPKDIKDIPKTILPVKSNLYAINTPYQFGILEQTIYKSKINNPLDVIEAYEDNEKNGMKSIDSDLFEIRKLISKIKYNSQKYSTPSEKEMIKNTFEIIADCLEERTEQRFPDRKYCYIPELKDDEEKNNVIREILK